MELTMMLLILPLTYLVFIKFYLHKTIAWAEWGLNILATIIIVVAVVQAGKYSQTSDFQVLNGSVLSKHKDTVSCTHSYETCSGSGDSRSCTTHYDHWNDYDWVVKTSVGSLTINRVDRQGERMPTRFRQVKIGEPASLESHFTNYVKAVPESLFNDTNINLITIDRALPKYPKVKDYYKMNRVINDDSKVSPSILHAINSSLNQSLITVGAKKQANIVVIFTSYKDGSKYKNALKKEWVNGKKNDVVVLIGLEDDKKISWVDSFGWSKKDMVNVVIRDEITKLKEVKSEDISNIIVSSINKHFVRDEMKNYEYLEGSIDPPLWVIILGLFLGLGVAVGLSIYFHRNRH